jgi:hypothetical protein
MRDGLDIADAAGSRKVTHFCHGSRRCTKLRPTVYQSNATRSASEFERPVERRVAATKDHQPLVGEVRRTLHLIVNVRTFELLRLFDTQATWLE